MPRDYLPRPGGGGEGGGGGGRDVEAKLVGNESDKEGRLNSARAIQAASPWKDPSSTARGWRCVCVCGGGGGAGGSGVRWR